MTLCLPVTGSSTYCERLLPSTRMRWLAGADCPAGRGHRFRGVPSWGLATPWQVHRSQLGTTGPAPLASCPQSAWPSSPLACGHLHPRPQVQLGREGLGTGTLSPRCQPLLPPSQEARSQPSPSQDAPPQTPLEVSPSLKSRPSSWLGQRFTTSVTCSAFL